MFVVEVELEAAFKGNSAGFLGPGHRGCWILPRGLCADEIDILRIEVGVFLELKGNVLVISIILAEIKVGEVEEWGSHSFACFLILFQKLYNTPAINSK